MDTRSLMEQIVSKDNLNAAYLQVVRNKGAAGVDGMTVEELGVYLWENGEEQGKELDETGRTTVGGIQRCLLWGPLCEACPQRLGAQSH